MFIETFLFVLPEIAKGNKLKNCVIDHVQKYEENVIFKMEVKQYRLIIGIRLLACNLTEKRYNKMLFI